MTSVVSGVLAAGSIVLLAGFRYREAPWVVDPETLQMGLAFGAAFLVAFPLLSTPVLRTDHPVGRLVRAAALGCVVCLPLTVAMLVARLEVSRILLATMLGVFFGLLLVRELPIGRRALLWLHLGLFAVAAYPCFSEVSRASLAELLEGGPRSADEGRRFVFSSLHDMEIREHRVSRRRRDVAGGGLDVIDGNRLLLVTGLGELFFLTIEGDAMDVRASRARPPMNRAAYVAAVPDPSKYFRVTDVLVDDGAERGAVRSVFVTHHAWDAEKACLTLQLAEAELEVGGHADEPLDWHNRFTSSPCIAKKMFNATGGRMALLPPSSLLVTVGETSASMKERLRDDVSSYGKILELDRRDWSAAVFSKGHRNPQGLWVDADGIWSTEHGPQGGDELNRIERGRDYGWPEATYGTLYGRKNWPRSGAPGEHPVGTRPIYAWVPSIGISSVIRVRQGAFHAWRGDFLVSSLDGGGHGHALFRVKLRGERAVVIERIETGRTIRDLVELRDGRIVIWDGYDTIQVLEPASHVFSTCIGCHSLKRGTQGIGPDLYDLVNRPVASRPVFVYSDALKDLGGRWSRARLDWFLTDPKRAVPGTTMEVPGIDDPAQRRRLIDYLVELSK